MVEEDERDPETPPTPKLLFWFHRPSLRQANLVSFNTATSMTKIFQHTGSEPEPLNFFPLLLQALTACHHGSAWEAALALFALLCLRLREVLLGGVRFA